MYIDDFIFVAPIETGGYSTVWKVKYKEKHYALKIISREKYKTKIQKKGLKMEIKIHKDLNHENIIKLYNSFEDKMFVYILMELAGDDLFNFYEKRQRLANDDILKICYQIIKGLVYLDTKKIIHSDIKMENILLDCNGNNVKICDFGFATQNSYHYNYVGTPDCMAPEILLSEMYTNKIDVWGVGIILYYMVFGRHPFSDLTPSIFGDKSVNKAICYGELFFPKETMFNDLIKKCLDKNKNTRISIQELQEHELFKKFN